MPSRQNSRIFAGVFLRPYVIYNLIFFPGRGSLPQMNRPFGFLLLPPMRLSAVLAVPSFFSAGVHFLSPLLGAPFYPAFHCSNPVTLPSLERGLGLSRSLVFLPEPELSSSIWSELECTSQSLSILNPTIGMGTKLLNGFLVGFLEGRGCYVS